ncbi:MAG TPA: TetR/AcrR family transcriptional regulator [Candidatus Cloacimonetes bacterium]|jgi:AcrR family transcriptional regulator|nr:TetR/AcrR family transcriptional regulator [Candidatus Cloacimonadota bacterium]
MEELSTNDTLELKKATIINAAMEVFAKNGYAKGSISDIAAKAEIGKATLYYYFDSKEAVFMEAVKLAYRQFFEVIEKQVASLEGFEARFRALVRLPIRYIYDHVPILVEARNSFPEAYVAELEALQEYGRQRMRNNLHRLFQEGMAENKVDDRFSFEALSNVVHDWMMMSELNWDIQEKQMIMQKLEREQDVLIDLVLYGILKRG